MSTMNGWGVTLTHTLQGATAGSGSAGSRRATSGGGKDHLTGAGRPEEVEGGAQGRRRSATPEPTQQPKGTGGIVSPLDGKRSWSGGVLGSSDADQRLGDPAPAARADTASWRRGGHAGEAQAGAPQRSCRRRGSHVRRVVQPRTWSRCTDAAKSVSATLKPFPA